MKKEKRKYPTKEYLFPIPDNLSKKKLLALLIETCPDEDEDLITMDCIVLAERKNEEGGMEKQLVIKADCVMISPDDVLTCVE